MSGTSHLQVRAAMAAAIRRAPALTARVDEQRDQTLPTDAPTSIAIFRDGSTADRGAILGAPMDWVTRIRVVAKARSISGLSADLAIDGLTTAIYQRVLADPSLGGVADDTEPEDITWDQDEADTSLAVAVITFRVRHRTAGGTLA